MNDIMIKKYRKKPVIIEAIKFTGKNTKDIEEFVGKKLVSACIEQGNRFNNFADLECVIIPTLEGNMKAMPCDYIIKGVSSEFYPCKPDIFEKTYEEITTTSH